MAKKKTSTASKKKIEVVDHASPFGTPELISPPVSGVRTTEVATPDLWFNLDIAPYQVPLFRKLNFVDVDNRTHREMIYRYSPVLRKLSEDIYDKILAYGFEITGQSTEVMPELIMMNASLRAIIPRFIALADTVGCQYLIRMNKRGKTYYYTYSTNIVHSEYINENGDIEEFYLNVDWGKNTKVKYAKTGTVMNPFKLGFLTQHSEDETRPARPQEGHNVRTPVLRKDAIVLLGHEDLLNPLGDSSNIRDCLLALQKLYVRMYQLFSMHTGGKSRTIVTPKLSSEYELETVRRLRRGTLDPGVHLELDIAGTQDIKDTVYLQSDVAIQPDYGVIGGDINSDSQFSKTMMEGGQVSSGWGNAASNNSAIRDFQNMEPYRLRLAEVIKLIYATFFDTEITGEVEFLEPLPMISPDGEGEATTEGQDPEGRQPGSPREPQVEGRDNSLEGFLKESFMRALNDPNYMGDILPEDPVYQESNLVLADHSINDEFVSFEGSAIPSGTYPYLNKKTGKVEYRYFSPQAIRTMCERDVRNGYLTPNHPAQTEEANDRVALEEGLGHYEVKRYDNAQMKDHTRANLRKEVWEALGRPQSIKTSPRIVMELDQNNVQRFFFKNLAVLDANNIPRSEAAGLDTTFHRVIDPFVDRTDHSLLNKVTDQEKARIRSMEGTVKEIAEKVGRSQSTVQRILGARGKEGSEEEVEMETPEEKEAREAAEEEEHIERLEKAQVEIAKHEEKGTKIEDDQVEKSENGSKVSKSDFETISGYEEGSADEFVELFEGMDKEIFEKKITDEFSFDLYFKQGSKNGRLIDHIYDLYEYIKDKEEIPIFRTIQHSTKDVDHPGQFWSFDPIGTNVYKEVKGNERRIEYVSTLKTSQIDWKKTVAQITDYPEEWEVIYDGEIGDWESGYREEAEENIKKYLESKQDVLELDEIDIEKISKKYHYEKIKG
jgi:predicted transcriptional regulator